MKLNDLMLNVLVIQIVQKATLWIDCWPIKIIVEQIICRPLFRNIINGTLTRTSGMLSRHHPPNSPSAFHDLVGYQKVPINGDNHPVVEGEKDSHPTLSLYNVPDRRLLKQAQMPHNEPTGRSYYLILTSVPQKGSVINSRAPGQLDHRCITAWTTLGFVD